MLLLDHELHLQDVAEGHENVGYEWYGLVHTGKVLKNQLSTTWYLQHGQQNEVCLATVAKYPPQTRSLPGKRGCNSLRNPVQSGVLETSRYNSRYTILVPNRRRHERGTPWTVKPSIHP